MTEREVTEFCFMFADGGTVSTNILRAGPGAFGSIIVPTGSNLIGKTVQFVAHSPSGLYADTDMLSTPKTLAAGSNPLSAAEIAEVGAINHLKLKVNSAVSGAVQCVLLWKS